MNTGLVMWWFGSIFEMPPVRFGAVDAGQRVDDLVGIGRTSTFSTAFTHMLKPM